MKNTRYALAAAITVLISGCQLQSASAPTVHLAKCTGAHSCAGSSACKGFGNANCAGQNSCGSSGFIEVGSGQFELSREICEKLGGMSQELLAAKPEDVRATDVIKVGRCEAVATCAGQSACAGASHDCAGQNSCGSSAHVKILTGSDELSASLCMKLGGKTPTS